MTETISGRHTGRWRRLGLHCSQPLGGHSPCDMQAIIAWEPTEETETLLPVVKKCLVFGAISVIDLRAIDSVTGSNNIPKTSTEWQRLDINIQTAIIQPTSCFRSCQSNHTHRVTLQLPPGKFSFQIQSVQSWRSLVRMQHFILLLLLLLTHVTMVTAIDGCYSDRDKDHRPRKNCTAAGFTDVPAGIQPSTMVKSSEFVLCSLFYLQPTAI